MFVGREVQHGGGADIFYPVHWGADLYVVDLPREAAARTLCGQLGGLSRRMSTSGSLLDYFGRSSTFWS